MNQSPEAYNGCQPTYDPVSVSIERILEIAERQMQSKPVNGDNESQLEKFHKRIESIKYHDDLTEEERGILYAIFRILRPDLNGRDVIGSRKEIAEIIFLVSKDIRNNS